MFGERYADCRGRIQDEGQAHVVAVAEKQKQTERERTSRTAVEPQSAHLRLTAT